MQPHLSFVTRRPSALPHPRQSFKAATRSQQKLKRKGPDKINGEMKLPEPDKDPGTNMNRIGKNKDIDLTKLVIADKDGTAIVTTIFTTRANYSQRTLQKG